MLDLFSGNFVYHFVFSIYCTVLLPFVMAQCILTPSNETQTRGEGDII